MNEDDMAHAFECRYCRPGSGYSLRIPSSVSPHFVHARGPEGSPQRVVCNASDGVPLSMSVGWSVHPGGEAFVGTVLGDGQ